MATIWERGPYQFCARVRLKRDGKIISETKTHETRKAAEEWASVLEGKIRGDEYVDRRKVRDTTVSQACAWFMDQLAPLDPETGLRKAASQHERNQLSKLKYWIESEFADWSLVSLKPWDLIAWRNKLLSEGECSPQTIVHRLNTLSQVYVNIALSQKLVIANPVVEKVRPPLGHGRERRLDSHPDEDGKTEETRLLESCAASSRTWLRTAVIISLETAMRQAELAGLTWDRVKLDMEHPYCDLPRTKNERPRRVPLSSRAVEAFRSLLPDGQPAASKASVFPVETPRAFGHAWRDVVTEDKFPDLRWHDLRHEAISRLFERTDLRDHEIMAISGHLRPEMLARYTHLRADRLAGRLG